MLSPTRRRALGAFYTPADVAERLVAVAFDGIDSPAPVCDPACGDGVFLLVAGRWLEAHGVDREHIARDLLWGIDVDADAVDAARSTIVEWSGVDPGEHLVVGDGLARTEWNGRFGVVVGNPPFLNQLEGATVRAGATRWSGAVGPYADTAFLFLLAGLDLLRPEGRLVLVEPQSLVAARDAAAVRNALLSRAALTGMWTCDEFIFDASACVCAPVFTRGVAQPSRVLRWRGRTVDACEPAGFDGNTTWSRYLARPVDVPAVDLDDGRHLSEVAFATAGFRDQFYGLAPYVVDRRDAEDRPFPRLVTCGVIDPARCAWGERPLRFAGRRWEHPRVDLHAMPDGALRRWVRDRLVPKVVLATQTRVLEAAVDVHGDWVPSTPVIAVHTDEVYRVAAVLLAPPVSAWALSAYGGVALTSDAIKLSAKQVLEIPLPVDASAWDQAAAALAEDDLGAVASLMTEAYECDPAVLDWWVSRTNTRRSS
jgi:N-6 DNA Methylase